MDRQLERQTDRQTVGQIDRQIIILTDVGVVGVMIKVGIGKKERKKK